MMNLNELAASITGRENSLFLEDIQEHKQDLLERIGYSRILVVGGAGSIGSSTIQAILPYHPSALHVVDHDENGLAELVRNLRSHESKWSLEDFRTLPLDYGSPVMQRFLMESPSYDFVLNFAALKHVRSEKDVFSLLQLLDTNIVKTYRLLDWISHKNASTRYFCVSTDKAANPVNFMGASKRAMERLIFSNRILRSDNMTASSARFANVAFSKGSLLESFLIRIQKKQSLAVPENTRRFFLSLQESGHICLLAAFLAPAQHILIPRLIPNSDLVLLEEVARRVLDQYGYQPSYYRDELEAKNNLTGDIAQGKYPVLLTPLDTSGEKPYEEFISEGEKSVDIEFKSVLAIHYKEDTAGNMNDFLEAIMQAIDYPTLPVSKEDVRRWLSSVVPQFQHRETHKNLDQRM